MQLLLENLGEARGQKQKRERAERTRPYAVADVHKWRVKSTGEILQRTSGEIAKAAGVGDTTVRAWIERGAGRGDYEHIRKLGRTVDGDFFAWMQSKPVKCKGGGARVQQVGDRLSSFADVIIVAMARYQQGEGIKSLARRYGNTGAITLTQMLRDGGIDTSERANYEPSRRCIRSANKETNRLICSTANGLLRKRVMGRIWNAMRGATARRAGSFRYTGCTVDQLREHIESQFSDGMTWDNYGEWHVDHIRPCASFDLSDEAQVYECFNWKNLQPLWARENLQKGARHGA